MNTMIKKANEASTENLMEMAMLLESATTKIAAMSRMAIMVVLEQRLGLEAFEAFVETLDA